MPLFDQVCIGCKFNKGTESTTWRFSYWTSGTTWSWGVETCSFALMDCIEDDEVVFMDNGDDGDGNGNDKSVLEEETCCEAEDLGETNTLSRVVIGG